MRGVGRRLMSVLSGPPRLLASGVRGFAAMSPRRKALSGLGATSLVAGVALVTVGLVGFVGSDAGAAVPPGPQDPVYIVEPLDRLDKPVRPPTTPTPAPKPPLGNETYRMVIDSIGVDAPVRTYGLDENAIPIVPTGDDAAEVVAWYDFSAKPGTGSNAVFAGHVTWFGLAVFWRLGEVKLGDRIRLTGQDGTELVYAVTESKLVKPDDPEALRVMYATDKDVITLITCGGSFSDTNDPVFGGQYSDRRVVRGALQSVSVAQDGESTAGGG